MKYEIDWPRNDCVENYHHHTIAMLTGLPIEEIKAKAPDRGLWHTRDYIKTFRDLGFNCNDRFIKFDPNTPYPCIMRYTTPEDKNHWYSEVYYDGLVYSWNNCSDLTSFKILNPELKITSMLQVWI